MVGAFVFMQASVVLAFCDMDAPALGQMMDYPSEDCCASGELPAATIANVCVAHCTSDLQTVGAPVTLVSAPLTPALMLPRLSTTARSGAQLQYPPPRAVPPRILFQSFLI
jgi:hypothetical protein